MHETTARNPGDPSGGVAKSPDVRIHYRRPPDRLEIFVQRLVHQEPAVSVTLYDGIRLKRPMMIDGRVALEDGSPIVWFTFPGLWHDIGRFHLADGTFTGLYANILTPVEFVDPLTWDTTDLFLDVWQPAGGGEPMILDIDEFEEARQRGWIDERTAARALDEAHAIVDAARRGSWPPPVVTQWTLDRSRRRAQPTSPPPGSR